MSDRTSSFTVRDPNQSLDYMRRIQAQQRTNEEGNGLLRAEYKRAKADGENVDVMRRVIRKLRSKSPEEILQDLRDEIEYLLMRRVSISATDLFSGANMDISEHTRHADDMWDAGEKGYRAGRLGAKVEDAPYQPGSELFDEWKREWQRGQEAIAREMGPNAQVASTSKKRPRQGRIPGTEAKQPSPTRRAAGKGGAKKKGGRKGGGRGRGAQRMIEGPAALN